MKNVSLTNFDDLIQIAAQEDYITKNDVGKLLAFRENPADESWRTKEACK